MTIGFFEKGVKRVIINKNRFGDGYSVKFGRWQKYKTTFIPAGGHYAQCGVGFRKFSKARKWAKEYMKSDKIPFYTNKWHPKI
jgi:hypothetical protein